MPRSSWIDGSATFTTVLSSMIMKRPTETAAKVHHLRFSGAKSRAFIRVRFGKSYRLRHVCLVVTDTGAARGPAPEIRRGPKRTVSAEDLLLSQLSRALRLGRRGPRRKPDQVRR